MAEGRHTQARHRQPRRRVIGPGIVKLAVPGATVAMVATGSAVSWPDATPVADVLPTATSQTSVGVPDRHWLLELGRQVLVL